MQVIIYLVLASIVCTKVENGTNKGPKRQIDNVNEPHKDSKLAKQGILESDAFMGEHITTESPQSCQQDQLDAMQKRMCNRTHHDLAFDARGAISFIDNVISVLDCDCTVAERGRSVLIGACPYGCGFTTEISRWSGLAFHPLTHNFSDVTNILCAGGSTMMVQCVVNVRLASAPWSTHTI